MRRGRADDNQVQIVSALRDLGARVTVLTAVGGGCPDLLVGWRGKTYLLEVKNLSGRGSILTPHQEIWHAAWNGGPLAVVRSVPEALSAIGID
jgi:hypothetical protein